MHKPETSETAGAATLTVSKNPNTIERILPMNMAQTSSRINTGHSHHLIDALEELDHIRDLCQLVHFAMEGMDEGRRYALRAGLAALEIRLESVTESIRWATGDVA